MLNTGRSEVGLRQLLGAGGRTGPGYIHPEGASLLCLPRLCAWWVGPTPLLSFLLPPCSLDEGTRAILLWRHQGGRAPAASALHPHSRFLLLGLQRTWPGLQVTSASWRGSGSQRDGRSTDFNKECTSLLSSVSNTFLLFHAYFKCPLALNFLVIPKFTLMQSFLTSTLWTLGAGQVCTVGCGVVV